MALVLSDRLGPSCLGLLLILALIAGTPPALAQTARNFRITWTVDKTGPVNAEVSGRVTNDARIDALDVYVTVEALDDKGKVRARGLTHVTSMLRASETEAFTAKVPLVPGVQSYRALVSSFRFGLGGAGQAP